ncbi:hypothetical protein TrST_g5456 [Triparma strigata]|uniref:Uncharacterized protein n=1 Tax=Triparma strigata TaxID=1606541 RepID=A0A9W7F4D0_9STRA|nr:hypothetical protein TrST_g5456 [Triparma strigata]
MSSAIPPRLLEKSKSTITPLNEVPSLVQTFIESIDDPEVVEKLALIIDCIEDEIGGGAEGGGVDFAALIKQGNTNSGDIGDSGEGKRKAESSEEEENDNSDGEKKKAKKAKKEKKEKKVKREKKEKKSKRDP